jgi:peptidoglycan/LPS O-acetylase OafA/YrhL
LQKTTIYFNGLNGLRFIAALFEIIYHTENFKLILGIPNCQSDFTTALGDIGVNLFFVISGFLVTYVLLIEHKQTGFIRIKNFYIRRALRIWPLYYLITILSFFVLPHILTFGYTSVFDYNYYNKLAMFLFFIPNVAVELYSAVPFASQMWGIGTEEQFYLCWPLLLRFFINKIWRFLIGCIVIIIFIRVLVIIASSMGIMTFNNFHYGDLNNPFPTILRFDCLAIGGVGAYLLFSNKFNFLNFLFNVKIQIVVFIALFFSIGTSVNFSVFHFPIYSFLLLCVMLNVALNKNSILKLENRFFNYFGKLSYGLYTFHPLCIIIVLKLLKGTITSLGTTMYNALLYSTVTIMSVLFAWLSYNYFERPFFKLKSKYSTIITGDSVK